MTGTLAGRKRWAYQCLTPRTGDAMLHAGTIAPPHGGAGTLIQTGGGTGPSKPGNPQAGIPPGEVLTPAESLALSER